MTVVDRREILDQGSGYFLAGTLSDCVSAHMRIGEDAKRTSTVTARTRVPYGAVPHRDQSKKITHEAWHLTGARRFSSHELS
ncbi:hypothetical protein [Amycolatopsis sp. NPDC004169]|uniref:hypothetical protein n=1 Tax=Amycolatopsis sp. NPDC004169 TaxID=3154453 RepID=UPI0033B7D96D